MNTTQTTPERVAWEVEINSMRCIVFATTKAKAKWIAVKSYWEAFGRKRHWPSLSVWRAERFDTSPLRNEPQQHAFSEDHVMNRTY